MGSIPQLSVLKGDQRDLVPRFLHKIFEEHVESQKTDQTAIIFNDSINGQRTTSYDTFNRNANQIASSILHHVTTSKSTANQDGDWIVAVCMSPTDKLIITLMAIWKTGAAYLPIDPCFPANRVEHILNESRPVLVIHDDSCKDLSIFGDTHAISYNTLEAQASDCYSGNIPISDTLSGGDNNLGIVLYTSGSTGVPKGVRLPHPVILNRLQWQWNVFPFSKTEKVGVFKTALTFVDSVPELWSPLLNGMSILVVPKEITRDPERLVDLLDSYRIERLVLVPTLLRSILFYLSMQKGKNLLRNLTLWVCSGESLPVSLAEEFFDYFAEGEYALCNFYGSTEVMGDVTYFICDGKRQLQSYDKVPIGFPLDNTVIYILDSDYRPVKIGQTGELFVAGLNLAQGYCNGRDQFRFIENPLAVDSKYNRLYRTGDYASVLKNGAIQYEGRTDSQIKIRGHRVDLSEIEKCLLSIDGVDKGIVLCYHPGEYDQELLAFITVTGDSKYQLGGQFEKILKTKLSNYMIPQVIIIDRIPLLVNGKIDRQSLLKSYENTNNNDDAAIELDFDYSGIPESQLNIAKDLFETVGEVIGRSTRTSVSLTSNFYELGGNSLNSIFTVTQLRNKGYFIGITEFITAHNLKEILDRITMGSKSDMVDGLENQMKLKSEPLAMGHKHQAIEIITSSFYEKADLEKWMKSSIFHTDYSDILEPLWPKLIRKNLSFVVLDESNQVIGVSFNFDARDEPEVEVNNHLVIIFDFLEYLEGPIRNNELPQGVNQILHSFMMGTSSELVPQQNIAVMNFMEKEVLKLAKERKFTGILTTNTSPLTQQLGSSVYGYKTMLDYQVNQYVYQDGSKPFGQAPDTQRALVHYKNIVTES